MDRTNRYTSLAQGGLEIMAMKGYFTLHKSPELESKFIAWYLRQLIWGMPTASRIHAPALYGFQPVQGSHDKTLCQIEFEK